MKGEVEYDSGGVIKSPGQPSVGTGHYTHEIALAHQEVKWDQNGMPVIIC